MHSERVAQNEGIFREINERIEELAERVDGVADFVCECYRADCTERIPVPVDEYERVRAHPRRFVVAPGHERPADERIVDERRGWLVVEKVGEAGERAAQDDPRGA